MPSRRAFLVSAAAASIAPGGWAAAGGARYLAAARTAENANALFGLDGGASIAFQIPLPSRGHAAAAHPHRAEAVAFGRRPATFAIVLDCLSGQVSATLNAPEGRHFYGHGAFSRDGRRLFTTENAYEEGEGRIGIWAAEDGYRRLGEVPSGGIGPHEILRLPDSDTLVVANGGIDTHPATGREKLNLPTMRANLTYLDGDGAMLEQWALPAAQRLSSIRHLAARADGLVAFACQWQGDLAACPPLQGLHRAGGPPRLLDAGQRGSDLAGSDLAGSDLAGYAGSIAFSGDGERLAVTYPRAGRSLVWDLPGRDRAAAHDWPDICGIAPARTGFLATTGTGRLVRLEDGAGAEAGHAAVAWDNHLVAIG